MKPTFSYAADMMASAAYEVASQTGRIFANESAMVGSIGTMTVLTDMTGLAEKLGIKVIPVTSGGMKGAGIPGTPITEEKVAYIQSLIDGMNDQFVGAVALGRNMSLNQARQLADGRVHLAEAAVDLGLIDGITSLENAITALQTFASQEDRELAMYANNNGHPATLAGSIGQQASPNPDPATAQPPQPVSQPVVPAQTAATVEEIEQSCPGAPAEFVLSQIKASSTIEQVQTAYIAHLSAENTRLQQQPAAPAPAAPVAAAEPTPASAAPAPAAVSAVSLPGNTPIEPDQDGDQGFSDPQSEWRNQIQREERILLEAGYNAHRARQEAVFSVNRNFPGLREAYLETLDPRPVTADPKTGRTVRGAVAR